MPHMARWEAVARPLDPAEVADGAASLTQGQPFGGFGASLNIRTAGALICEQVPAQVAQTVAAGVHRGYSAPHTWG